MSGKEQGGIFRQETIERVSSPEQLTDYLRVTNPGIWALLGAVLLLLAGILAWSAIGTLETRAAAKVTVRDSQGMITAEDGRTLSEGMVLRVGGQEYGIYATARDEENRPVGKAEVKLPDGVYEGTVVVESIHPIQFLYESR